MNFINIAINEVLLLSNFSFSDPSNSIDFLNHQAISIADSNASKLSLLTKAIYKVERFHSFFHFEQSYFHTQLAVLYHCAGDDKKAEEQLNLAIFQDHINNQAKQMLTYRKFDELYLRPYKCFAEYISFAASEKVKDAEAEGYWCMGYSTIPELNKILEEIRFHHLRYHEEASKIYLNRALVFQRLGQLELAKNDLVKAHNLDNKLEQKEYYAGVRDMIGT